MIKKILAHNVTKNVMALGILQIANYFIPLLAWPLIAKILGVEQFGLLMILFTICAMANVLTDFGFNLSATHVIAQNFNNKEKIGQLLGNIFFIKMVFACVAGVVTSTYVLFTSNYLNLWTIVFLNLIIFSQVFHCVWFFQGIEKMKYITQVNIIAKIIYVGLLFILLPFFQNINLVLICFFICQLCISILFLVSIYKEDYYILNPQRTMLWNEIKYSFSFFISRVAVSVYTLVNIMIVGNFSGNVMAGLYGSAEKVYVAGSSIAGIVSQALYPYVTKTNNLKLLVTVTIGLAIPVFLGSYVLSIFSEEIMILFFGKDFYEAAGLLKLFLILLCITFISVNIGYPGFSAIKRVYWANYTVMIGAIFHFIGLIALYFCNLISAENVLLITICTEFLVLSLRIGILSYFNKHKMIYFKNYFS